MRFDIRVPATTANMGPGFDAMGCAVNLYNQFVIAPSDRDSVEWVGNDADMAVQNPSNHLVVRLVHQICAQLGKPLPGVSVWQQTDIPQTRGLGSSASCVVAAVGAAYAFCEHPLDTDLWIRESTRLEGHPDNVAPAIVGGITVCAVFDNEVSWLRIEPPQSLWLAAFIPDFQLSTHDARSVLPTHIPHADGVFNGSRAALLAAALSTERLDLLSVAMQDRLHQPYRAALVPDWNEIEQNARQAGALALTLSGAGPTLMAYGANDAQLFLRSLRRLPKGWQVELLQPTSQGILINEDE